jgi:hypothetical protein
MCANLDALRMHISLQIRTILSGFVAIAAAGPSRKLAQENEEGIHSKVILWLSNV